MEHGEKNFTMIDEDGNEHLCEILFTFDSEDTGNSYVVYSPIGELDEEGEPYYHASVFVPNAEGEEEGQLMPVESDEEWEMIEEVLNTFLEEEEDEHTHE